MTLSSSEINEIVRALQETDWDEAVITVDGVSIALARNGAHLAAATTATPIAAPAVAPAPVAAPAPQAPVPATPVPPANSSLSKAGRQSEDVVVTATSVGVFWAASEPGAAPFVTLGASVNEHDVVCIIEIMKLMNHVPAGVSGVVTEILAENGQAVELGTPLFVIRPQEG